MVSTHVSLPGTPHAETVLGMTLMKPRSYSGKLLLNASPTVAVGGGLADHAARTGRRSARRRARTGGAGRALRGRSAEAGRAAGQRAAVAVHVDERAGGDARRRAQDEVELGDEDVAVTRVVDAVARATGRILPGAGVRRQVEAGGDRRCRCHPRWDVVTSPSRLRSSLLQMPDPGSQVPSLESAFLVTLVIGVPPCAAVLPSHTTPLPIPEPLSQPLVLDLRRVVERRDAERRNDETTRRARSRRACTARRGAGVDRDRHAGRERERREAADLQGAGVADGLDADGRSSTRRSWSTSWSSCWSCSRCCCWSSSCSRSTWSTTCWWSAAARRDRVAAVVHVGLDRAGLAARARPS